MTAQPSTSRRRPVIAVLAIVILAAVIAGAWYLFLPPAGPAPVSLGSAAPTMTAPAAQPSR